MAVFVQHLYAFINKITIKNTFKMSTCVHLSYIVNYYNINPRFYITFITQCHRPDLRKNACGLTVLFLSASHTHFIHALHTRTSYTHFIHKLHTRTSYMHFIHALYTCTSYMHFIHALHIIG